jgi:ATP-dependent DNA helicase DinG
MRCAGCSFVIPWSKAPDDHRCMMCGLALRPDSDDFLLHGMNGLIRDVRAGQVEMGRLVEKVISEESVGLIEGPVGSGKSFGYGVPSILSGKRIVISTAKKGLQHQLARKDIPFLGEKLGKDVQVALLKGKGNYACRVKAFDVPAEHQQEFVKWLDESEYGDLTDYPGKRPFFWGDVTAEDCVGSKCKFASKCGYWKAKQQTKTAQVVIANHHVVAFDLRFGPRKMLGPYDVLVIDEAHQAPGAFRGAYALSVGPYTHKRIIRQIDRVGLNTGMEKLLEQTWEKMFQSIDSMDGEVAKDPFGAAGDDAIKILQDLLTVVKREMSEAGLDVGNAEDGEEEDDTSGGTSGGPVDWAQVAKLEMLKKAVERPLLALETAKEPDENTVLYIQTTERKNKVVNVAPISVGPMVGPKWQMIPSIIVTSATMAIAGNFDDIKRQLGFDWKPKPAPSPSVLAGPTPLAVAAGAVLQDDQPPVKKIEELVLASPFDYRRQALLYTPKDVPLPASPASSFDPPEKHAARDAYLRSITAHCLRLIRAADGNAFILFTSNQDLNDVHQRLLQEDLDNTLIPQGDDAEAAFRQFKETPRSVILGNKSFWEGVDVQGDKLWLVIITKLPFPLLSDPVLQARQRQLTEQLHKKGLNESAVRSQLFNTLQVPSMITDLRQGAGRLIRSVTDRGVLAILDTRVWTGNSRSGPTSSQTNYHGYGAQVVNATGFTQRTPDFNVVDRVYSAWRGKTK